VRILGQQKPAIANHPNQAARGICTPGEPEYEDLNIGCISAGVIVGEPLVAVLNLLVDADTECAAGKPIIPICTDARIVPFLLRVAIRELSVPNGFIEAADISFDPRGEIGIVIGPVPSPVEANNQANRHFSLSRTECINDTSGSTAGGVS